MSNILQYVSKSTVIDQLTADLIQNIYRQYEAGEIQTETELHYQLDLALQEALSRLHQPNYSHIPAYSTPVSSDYNQMIETARRDLNFLLSDCEQLSSSLRHTFDESELMRQTFDAEIRYINQQLIDMKEKLSKESMRNRMVFTESFSSDEYVDHSRTDLAAAIHKTNGLLTLKPVSSQSFMGEAVIEILPGSTGLPGNTHMADMIGSHMVFDGNSEPHLDLRAAIDETSDTWFEYEIFNVSDDVMDRCSHHGFHYKEGLSWVTDEQQLTLKLKISFPTRPVANWVTLTPFISERKGIKAGQVLSCLISDGSSQIQEDKRPRKFDSDLVYTFEPQVVDHLIVEIQQLHSYPVQVGHRYYLKSNASNSGYFSNGDKELSKRTNGAMPSVQNLGLFYDPLTRTYTQPKSNAENLHLVSIEETKANLFNPPASDQMKIAGLELIEAQRYSIGIRNISLAHYTFDETSEYVSSEFTSEKAITGISLEATEHLPKEWSDQVDQAIQYDISIDQGATWHPITPRHRAFGKKCRYDVNSGDIMRYFSKRASINSGVLTSFEDVHSVRVRITLKRLLEMTHQTPIVSEYKLKFIVGEDTLD